MAAASRTRSTSTTAPAAAPTTAIATYKGVTTKALDQASATAGGSDSIKLKQGANQLRIMPSVGRWEAIVGVSQHYVEVSTDIKFYANCPAKMAKRPCPICQACDEMAKSQNPLDQERAERWKAKGRYFVNAILRGEENLGPRVFAFGWKIKDWLEKQLKKEGDWANPTAKGYDIIIEKSGEKMSTDYSCTTTRDCYDAKWALTPAQMKEWLTPDALIALDTKAIVMSYDDLMAKMNPPEASGYDARREGVQRSAGRLDNGHTIDAQDGDPGPSDEDEDGV